jgi:hypothetical protein
MKKKGIELSINVIIIAAISLVVLVLLIFLVLKSGTGINKSTYCENLGGSCVSTGESCGDYARKDITKTCSPDAAKQGLTVCCIQLDNSAK